MENFVLVDIPDGTVLAACPVCHSSAEIWRRSDGPDEPSKTAVMCSYGDAIGEQSNKILFGCLLGMPPEDFYHGTIREAVAYWNEYAVAVERMRAINSNDGYCAPSSTGECSCRKFGADPAGCNKFSDTVAK